MAIQKAYFKNLETGEQISVAYNPTELSFSKSAQFAEIAIPGLDAPVQQFISGGTESISIELFFDTTDKGTGENATSVTEQTDAFYQLVKQNPETHAPPRCLFAWGENSGARSEQDPVSQAPFWFTCIVETVDRKFLLFSPEGIPLRARLTVKLREYKTVEEMVRPLHSSDHTKARTLKASERLEQIAAREYGRPGEWRRIAEANDVDNPLDIPEGQLLEVPPMQLPSVLRRPTR
jgi:nucleoid-associated protein YgaU